MLDIILHLDTYLQSIVQEYAGLTYLILFLIIFLETGVVAMPFLPGDSLLFTVGAIAATGGLNVLFVWFLLLAAAILGDTVNYHLGKYFGPKVFRRENSRFFNKEYLVRSQHFYEKHGTKTIILARFIPVIRTFAPFVAGIGKMSYGRFLAYNALGGLLWCSIFVFGGYFFGNLPFVQENFNWIILGIIVVSLIPVVKEMIVHLRHGKVR